MKRIYLKSFFSFTCFIIFSALLTQSYAVTKVNISKSSFNWKATKITGDFHIGTIKMKSANISFKQNKIFRGEFVADINSIDVSDLSGKWKAKFLKHMKNEDFFEISKYPTAKFKITSFKNEKMKGILTIKGKSHPVAFKVSQSQNTWNAKLIFNRTKFGMIYASNNFFKNLGDKVIKDNIELTIKLVVE